MKHRRWLKAPTNSSKMKFCPHDGTLLVVDNQGSTNGFRFRCAACPYIHPYVPTALEKVAPPLIHSHRITSSLKERVYLKVKKVDDVLGESRCAVLACLDSA